MIEILLTVCATLAPGRRVSDAGRVGSMASVACLLRATESVCDSGTEWHSEWLYDGVLWSARHLADSPLSLSSKLRACTPEVAP